MYQLASWRDDERPKAVLLSPPLAQQDLEDGDEERERLARSGPRSAEDVLSLESEGETALLDVGHACVVGRFESGEGLAREGEVAKLLCVGCVLFMVTLASVRVEPASLGSGGDARRCRPAAGGRRGRSARRASSAPARSPCPFPCPCEFQQPVQPWLQRARSVTASGVSWSELRSHQFRKAVHLALRQHARRLFKSAQGCRHGRRRPARPPRLQRGALLLLLAPHSDASSQHSRLAHTGHRQGDLQARQRAKYSRCAVHGRLSRWDPADLGLLSAVSAAALHLCAEYLRLFATEAIHRASEVAEKERAASGEAGKGLPPGLLEARSAFACNSSCSPG